MEYLSQIDLSGLPSQLNRGLVWSASHTGAGINVGLQAGFPLIGFRSEIERVVAAALAAQGQVLASLSLVSRIGSHAVQGALTPHPRIRNVIAVGNGKVLDTVSQKVAMPVATGNGITPLGRATCDILSLVLAPLDLDLLGLQVHLDRVVLNIVAVSGAGNLLGNLLCAVAGLLDGNTPLSGILSQLNRLLNQILGLLNLGV